MRVLFLIPKSSPPELQGNFTKIFKEFVALCLNKDPKNVSWGGEGRGGEGRGGEGRRPLYKSIIMGTKTRKLCIKGSAP